MLGVRAANGESDEANSPPELFNRPDTQTLTGSEISHKRRNGESMGKDTRKKISAWQILTRGELLPFDFDELPDDVDGLVGAGGGDELCPRKWWRGRYTKDKDKCPVDRSTPSEPEWPVEHRCECCGEAVWRVMTSDGDELEIDVAPLDIRVVGDQCVRENPVCRLVEAEGGYVLHDPQLFRGWQRDASLEEPAAWQWFISRMSLSRSVDEKVVLRSAHAASCRAMTPRERAGSLARNRGERGSRRELQDMQEIGLRLLAASGADKYVPPAVAPDEPTTPCQQPEVPLRKQLSLF